MQLMSLGTANSDTGDTHRVATSKPFVCAAMHLGSQYPNPFSFSNSHFKPFPSALHVILEISQHIKEGYPDPIECPRR